MVYACEIVCLSVSVYTFCSFTNRLHTEAQIIRTRLFRFSLFFGFLRFVFSTFFVCSFHSFVPLKRTASFLAPLPINERTILFCFYLISDRFKYRQCYQCVTRLISRSLTRFHNPYSLFHSCFALSPFSLHSTIRPQLRRIFFLPPFHSLPFRYPFLSIPHTLARPFAHAILASGTHAQTPFRFLSRTLRYLYICIYI